MKTFAIYLKQSNKQVIDIEYIPETFNFTGFLFSIIWLIYQRLWIYSLIFILLLILIIQLNQTELINPNTFTIALIGLSIFIGLIGNDLLCKRLEKQGYVFYDVVIASSESEAELKFICMNYKEEESDE